MNDRRGLRRDGFDGDARPTGQEIPALEWSAARKLVQQAVHVAVASCGPEGQPHVTPIGSLSLHPTEPRGYWLEKFTTNLPRHVARDERVQILVVTRSSWYWLKSLWRGSCAGPPALRLVGTAGPRRQTTPVEVERFRRKVRFLRRFKGHDLLWSEMPTARDVTLNRIIPVQLGRMWPHRGEPAAVR